MNWTGGRLQRYSRSNSNRVIRTQKEHFAKARLQSQLTSTQLAVPEFSLFKNTKPHYRNADVVNLKQKRQSFSVNDQTAKSKQFQASPSRELSKSVQERSSKLAQLSTVKSPSVNNQAAQSIETARLDLLNRTDWLGTAATKPVHIGFSPQRRMRRIARHRLVAELARDGHEREHEQNGPEALISGKEAQRACKRKHSQYAGDYTDLSAESESRTDQVHVSHSSQKLQSPYWRKSRSDISTGSLLAQKFEKFVKGQSEARSSPSTSSIEDNDPRSDKIEPKLVSLSAIRHLSSFDEVNGQFYHYSASSSDHFSIPRLHAEELQDNKCDGRPSSSQDKFERSKHGPSVVQPDDRELLCNTQPEIVSKHVTNSIQPLANTAAAMNVQRKLQNSKSTSDRSNPDSGSMRLRSIGWTDRVFETDRQCANEKDLSEAQRRPASTLPSSTDSAHSRLAGSVYYRPSTRAPTMTQPCAERLPASKPVLPVRSDPCEENAGRHSGRTTYLRSQKYPTLQRKISSAMMTKNKNGYKTQQAWRHAQQWNGICSVSKKIQDKNEAWVNHVFADDLGQVQKEFQFHDTPTRKPLSDIGSSKKCNIQTRAETVDYPSHTDEDSVFAMSTDIPSAENITILDHVRSVDSYGGHQVSETDLLIQLSPIEGVLDERIKSLSAYHNPARSKHSGTMPSPAPIYVDHRNKHRGLSSTTCLPMKCKPSWLVQELDNSAKNVMRLHRQPVLPKQEHVSLTLENEHHLGAAREDHSVLRAIEKDYKISLSDIPITSSATPLHDTQHIGIGSPILPIVTEPRPPIARLSPYFTPSNGDHVSVTTGRFHLSKPPKNEKTPLLSDLRSSSYL